MNKVVNKDHVELMTRLHKHELAACEVYKKVLDHISETTIHDTIAIFLKDHERHVEDSSRLLEEISGEKPEMSRDLEGLLLGGITTLRSLTGQDGALAALKTAEENILKHYQKSINQSDLSPSIIQLLQQNLKDEERHGAYIKAHT